MACCDFGVEGIGACRITLRKVRKCWGRADRCIYSALVMNWHFLLDESLCEVH